MQNNISIPSSTSSYIKLIQLAIAVLGIWFVLNSWVKTSHQGQAILQSQAEQLMRENLITLSQAAAYLISLMAWNSLPVILLPALFYTMWCFMTAMAYVSAGQKPVPQPD